MTTLEYVVVTDTARRIKQGMRRAPLEYDLADIWAELEQLVRELRELPPDPPAETV